MNSDNNAILIKASELAKTAESKGIIALEKEYDLNRAVIYHMIHLDGLDEDLKELFRSGKIGLKPLVELDKKYKSSELLQACNTFIEQNPDKNIKKPAIVRILSNQAVPESEQVQDSTSEQEVKVMASEQEVTAPKSTSENRKELNVSNSSDAVIVDQGGLKDAQKALKDIVSINTEAAGMSQDGESLKLYKNDFIRIMEKVTLLQQFLDDLDTNKDHQGDPTDQSHGSYVFGNMVDESLNYDSAPDYENESQERWA